MKFIYTNIWKNENNNNFSSEGNCMKSAEDALEYLNDYLYQWQNNNYSYHTTYVENISTGEVNRINLF